MESAKQNKANVINMSQRVQIDGKNENSSPGKASQTNLVVQNDTIVEII
jgi:hypothetical protein